MVTKRGSAYATLVVAYLEVKVYNIFKLEKVSAFAEHYVKTMFLDDCFCIWALNIEM